jgi:glutathione S-transferase
MDGSAQPDGAPALWLRRCVMVLLVWVVAWQVDPADPQAWRLRLNALGQVPLLLGPGPVEALHAINDQPAPPAR